jgi:hypothetical protein
MLDQLPQSLIINVLIYVNPIPFEINKAILGPSRVAWVAKRVLSCINSRHECIYDLANDPNIEAQMKTLAIYTDVSEAKSQYNCLIEKYKADHLFKLFVDCRETWAWSKPHSKVDIFNDNLIQCANFETNEAKLAAYDALFDYIFTDKAMILAMIWNINITQYDIRFMMPVSGPIRQFIRLLVIKGPQYIGHIWNRIYLHTDYILPEPLDNLYQLSKVLDDKVPLIQIMAARRPDIDAIIEIMADDLKSAIYEDSSYRIFTISRLVYLFEKGLVNITYVLSYLMKENIQGLFDLIEGHWDTIGRPSDQILTLAEEHGRHEVIEYITGKLGHGYIYENEFSIQCLLE